METMRLGRNDVCRCGSGKKYKKCCLARQPSPASPQPLRRSPSPPRDGSHRASDGIPEYVIVKDKGRTHRSKLQPGDECRLKDGSWALYRPDLMNGGSVLVKDKGWTPKGELKPGDRYEYDGVWVTFGPERVIGTTEEHPLYVRGKGWTPVREIKENDLIRTEDGWVPVGKIEDTGRWETVYNLQVEDDHTYFVGGPEWGFAVWAHNAYFVVDASQVPMNPDVPGFPAMDPVTQGSEDGMTGYARWNDNGTVRWARITSGNYNSLIPMAVGTGNQIPGITSQNYGHLEAQAAYFMRTRGISNLELFIPPWGVRTDSNGNVIEQFGPCGFCRPTFGGRPSVGAALPSSAAMTVSWIDRAGGIAQVVFGRGGIR